MNITLSRYKYAMLMVFVNNPLHYMTIGEAQTFDQRPFRSMLIQRWIAYRPGKGFHITREGREAAEQFQHTEIARKNPLLPLTAYFDPTAYGIKREEKVKRVRAE